MTYLIDAFLAMQCNLPFSVAFKRIRHMRNGHGASTLIEKLRSHKHPHTDSAWVYTVNVMHCEECGLEYIDQGLEQKR